MSAACFRPVATPSRSERDITVTFRDRRIGHGGGRGPRPLGPETRGALSAQVGPLPGHKGAAPIATRPEWPAALLRDPLDHRTLALRAEDARQPHGRSRPAFGVVSTTVERTGSALTEQHGGAVRRTLRARARWCRSVGLSRLGRFHG